MTHLKHSKNCAVTYQFTFNPIFTDLTCNKKSSSITSSPVKVASQTIYNFIFSRSIRVLFARFADKQTHKKNSHPRSLTFTIFNSPPNIISFSSSYLLISCWLSFMKEERTLLDCASLNNGEVVITTTSAIEKIVYISFSP